MTGAPRRLTLYGLPGCHLCEGMRAAMETLRPEFEFVVDEVAIDGDSALAARYGEDIPVLADGELELCRHYFDAVAVRAHLSKFR